MALARRRPGRVGAARRGVVVTVATARLICACRVRRSAVRRTVPLTYGENLAAQNIHGDHFLPRRRLRRAASSGVQLVISAHTNPASSRATAVTTTPGGLPRAVILA